MEPDSVPCPKCLLPTQLSRKEEAGTRFKLDVWMENQAQDKIVVGEASCIR